MQKHTMTEKMIEQYLEHLRFEERSEHTICRYRKALEDFYRFLPEKKTFGKGETLNWKEQLSKRYAASTVNVMLSAVNGFSAFYHWHECRVKPIKRQRGVFRDRRREMSRAEYLRLLDTAQQMGKQRLYYIMETLCSTGMRISELRFVTVEALSAGHVCVNCKGKLRVILLTKRLIKALREYCRLNEIHSGPVFVTRTGKPVDRSNIWQELQKLCKAAGVHSRKVFPHNFRHLFAVSFYHLEKDIAKLADVLGHASLETTRIYIMESGLEHERQLERLGLVQ